MPENFQARLYKKMKYLIKDLAALTNISKDRIRKWQERYKLLQPTLGDNGYYYYSNEDFYVLNAMKQKLDKGYRLKDVVQLAREDFLTQNFANFNISELKIISLIEGNQFFSLARIYDQRKREKDFIQWVQEDLCSLIEVVGKAWQEKLITVAEEHAFSKWFFGYFDSKIRRLKTDTKPNILVCVYSKDEHELGALLHYGILLYKHRRAKFCGNLPEFHILKELASHKYTELHISLVLKRTHSELEFFKRRILSRFSDLKIVFGGCGVGTKK